MDAEITPSQTIGPFPHEGWRWATEATAAAPPGAALTLTGVVYDGAGAPIEDAVLEVWTPESAAAEQTLPIPAFRRVPTDERGAFRLPLSAPAAAGHGEPVMYVTLFARGLLTHQFTAVFLEDDAGLANSALLQQVPAPRRATLLARRSGPGEYRWDIWMQTERETVFFDYA